MLAKENINVWGTNVWIIYNTSTTAARDISLEPAHISKSEHTRKGRKGVFVIKSDAIRNSRIWGNIQQATTMLRCAPLLVKTVQNTLNEFRNCTHFIRCLNCTQFFRCPCKWISRREGNTKYQSYFYVWTANLLHWECVHMFVGKSASCTTKGFDHIF